MYLAGDSPRSEVVYIVYSREEVGRICVDYNVDKDWQQIVRSCNITLKHYIYLYIL